jgi:hypothetical protein
MNEGPKEIFLAKQDVRCYKCAGLGHFARNCRWEPRIGSYSGKVRDQAQTRQAGRSERGIPEHCGRCIIETASNKGPRRQAQTWIPPTDRQPTGMQCFNCQEYGHWNRDCPKKNKARKYPNGQGSMPRSPVSNTQGQRK